MKKAGNAEHGKKLLAASLQGEAQCLRCHTVLGKGGSIGPDLSMIGKKGSRENLFESILTPSKAIADQYLQWNVDTSNGQRITGLIVQQTAKSLTLRDANGKDYEIPVAEIEGKKKSDISLMPDNLVASMSQDDLIDLVEYLLTLKTASLTPEIWQIIGPFPNGEDDKGLDKVLPPETKFDLKATYEGKSGKVSWKTVKPQPNGYVDLQAHYNSASVDITSLLRCEIDSPAEQEGTLLLGNDDGVKLWVNGELVFTNRDHNAANPGDHSIKVKLKKGPNVVQMKIVNGNNPHGFYFTLNSEQELKLVPVQAAK